MKKLISFWKQVKEKSSDMFTLFRVGIGVKVPTHKLHVKDKTSPVKIEGLSQASYAEGILNYNIVLVDPDGVLCTKGVSDSVVTDALIDHQGDQWITGSKLATNIIGSLVLGSPLTVANGGTGATTFTSNSLLTGNGTSAIEAESNLSYNGGILSVGDNSSSSSKILKAPHTDGNGGSFSVVGGDSLADNGVGGDVRLIAGYGRGSGGGGSFQFISNNTHATASTVGDLTVAGTLSKEGNLSILGDLTVSGGNITNAVTFDAGLTGSLTGNASGSAGTVTTIGDLTGDVTSSNRATTIAADFVTYAKMQNVSATDRILGRDSSGAGIIEEITPTNLRTMINVEDGATADQSQSDINGLAITTVGTIGTGVWEGTTIKTAFIGDDQVTEDKLADTLLAEIDANTAKNTNVVGDLTLTASATKLQLNTTNGDNVAFPEATTLACGVMSDSMFDEHTANIAKLTFPAGITYASETLTVGDDDDGSARIERQSNASGTGGLGWGGPLVISAGDAVGTNKAGGLLLLEAGQSTGNNSDVSEIAFYTYPAGSSGSTGNTSTLAATVTNDSKLRLDGGTLQGPTNGDLTIASDGNMTFRIDEDNDETGQKFSFQNNASTVIASLDESGNLSITGTLAVGDIDLTSVAGQSLTITAGIYDNPLSIVGGDSKVFTRYQDSGTAGTNVIAIGALGDHSYFRNDEGSFKFYVANDATVGAEINQSGDLILTGDIELGNASDTTIARSGAGTVTIEGNEIQFQGAKVGQYMEYPIRDLGTYLFYIYNDDYWYSAGSSTLAILGNGSAPADVSSSNSEYQSRIGVYTAMEACTLKKLTFTFYWSSSVVNAADIDFGFSKFDPITDGTAAIIAMEPITATDHDGTYTESKPYQVTFTFSGGNATFAAGDALAFHMRTTGGSNGQRVLVYGGAVLSIELN